MFAIRYKTIWRLAFFLYCCYLFGCASQVPQKTTVSDIAKTLTLAVWDFDDNSVVGGDLGYLSKALSEMLLADLSQHTGIRLVERVNLRQALQEQHLGSSELASEESKLKLGRIAGANHMAFGSYMAMAGQVRVDVRVVDVETSLVKFSEDAITTPSGVAAKMQALAQHLAAKLANASFKPNQTTDMAQWKTYESGIGFMDQHQYDQAIAVFTELLKTNPNFTAAEKQLELALERQSRQ